MAKTEKEFNTKAYGIFAIILVAAVLVALTVTTFISRYTGYYEDRVAKAYVSTIVDSGDGYNAYKNSLLSKDQKFGDFIRKNYLYPVIYENYKPGDSTSGLKGLDAKEVKGEKTLEDDGTLLGKLIDTMYPFYVSLIEENGSWDNYDKILTSYVSELKAKRAEIYGDEFFDDEVFFTCIEANISSYGDTLTGTEDAFDKNTGVQTSFASEGAYQEKYGEGYRITVKVLDTAEGENNYESDEIKNVGKVTLQVLVNDTPVVDSIEVTVVQVGNTWYVDNEACDTTPLYNFYK